MKTETEQLQVLTQDKFKEIYTNEKLRNAVAFAHSVCKSNGEEEYKKALLYPVSYKVTEEQIKQGNTLRNKKAKKVLKENKHNLLFVGMGMEFEPTLKDGVGNHRIRTKFLNKDGIKCFIELGKGKDDNLRVDFALYNYCEDDYNISIKERATKQKYNYMNLEREPLSLKYTYENVLNLVNKYFNCNFEKMVIDYYNISCSGIICKSP